MDNNILSALAAINVAELTRADWIAVGMALKEEGFPCSVWDDWSQNDSRYHAGECQKKWDGFHGNHKPVKAGTIIQMAKDRGWAPYTGEAGCMNWNDTIEYDGEDAFTGFPQETWNPVQDSEFYYQQAAISPYGKWIIPRKCFETLIELKFEDQYFKCPCDSDTYLKYAYGDYMKLPPVEKRVNHHNILKLDFGD